MKGGERKIEYSGRHAPKPEPRDANRPLMNFIPPGNTVPVGGSIMSLSKMTGNKERIEELERQLAGGQTIVEIDPTLIDGSFVNDRLGIDPTELGQLVEQIREHGQQVPILVRPHPSFEGRWQVAYGHRRLAATKVLGVHVRAVVRELSDEELVVSQGQENNARTNLSFIERALFAWRLEERHFSRELAMAALGIDKAALSRMITVIRQVPENLIRAIGAAPEVGRRRWIVLGELVAGADVAEALEVISNDDWQKAPSAQRFQHVFDLISKKGSGSKPIDLFENIESVPVRIKRNSTGATFVFDSKSAPGFDDFVQARLESLFHEFTATTGV